MIYEHGLVDAVEILPGVIHRFCAFHIWENFKKRFSSSQFKRLFWAAANTANYNEFQHILVEVRQLSVDAYEWLTAIEVSHLSRCKFENHTKVDLNTNNHTESFNGWVNSMRHHPPIKLLEGIRDSCSQLLYTRHVISSRYTGQFPPKVKKLINTASRKFRSCVVHRCGEYEFQVEFNKFRGSVRLDEKLCECNMWQLSGIPYLHALACINIVRAPIEDYVDGYYSIAKWRNTYAGIIHPIPSMNFWPPMEGMDLKPPVARAQPGRPKKRRRRAARESTSTSRTQSSTKRCHVCKTLGHNRRTCPQTVTSGANISNRGRGVCGGHRGGYGSGTGSSRGRGRMAHQGT